MRFILIKPLVFFLVCIALFVRTLISKGRKEGGEGEVKGLALGVVTDLDRDFES